MSQDLLLLFATLGAAGITGIVTYFASIRSTKGTVRTSEASDLWDEANNIRQWLTAEVSACRNEISALRTVVENQGADLIGKGIELAHLRDRAEDCEAREAILRRELQRIGGSDGGS